MCKHVALGINMGHHWHRYKTSKSHYIILYYLLIVVVTFLFRQDSCGLLLIHSNCNKAAEYGEGGGGQHLPQEA